MRNIYLHLCYYFDHYVAFILFYITGKTQFDELNCQETQISPAIPQFDGDGSLESRSLRNVDNTLSFADHQTRNQSEFQSNDAATQTSFIANDDQDSSSSSESEDDFGAINDQVCYLNEGCMRFELEHIHKYIVEILKIIFKEYK